jgi:hypothetical protein
MHCLSFYELRTLGNEPTANGGVAQQRVELAFVEANLRTNDGRSKIGRDLTEGRSLQNLNLESK